MEVVEPDAENGHAHISVDSPRSSQVSNGSISSNHANGLAMPTTDDGDLSLSRSEFVESVVCAERFLEMDNDSPRSSITETASNGKSALRLSVGSSQNHPDQSPLSAPVAIVKPEDIDVRMRTAAVMLAQLYHHQNTQSTHKVPLKSQPRFDEIRARLIQEMMDLESVRLGSLQNRLGDLSLKDMTAAPGFVSQSPPSLSRLDHEDPSAAVFKEPWSVKRERIRMASPYGSLPNWQLLSVIVKTGADLRQEQLALQLIDEMSSIWKKDGVPVWVYEYACFFRKVLTWNSFKILIMSDQSGLIETIQDAISVHSIKKQGTKKLKNDQKAFTLFDYFCQVSQT